MKQFTLATLILLLLIGSTYGQQKPDEKMKDMKGMKHMEGMKHMAMKDTMMSEHKQGMEDQFVGSMVAQFDGLQKKFVDLAQAFPTDKLTWRPSDGVRSVREVLTHIGDANLLFLSMAGVKMPDGPPLPKDRMERENRFTTTDELVKHITASFDYAKAQVSTMTHDQIHADTKMFGQNTNNMNVLIFSVGHLHEHLGQTIAYARTNGVVPPWSAN